MTSQHQAPGSVASQGHGQTHVLPLAGDRCLNRTAKDKGTITLKLDIDDIECVTLSRCNMDDRRLLMLIPGSSNTNALGFPGH